MSFKGAPFPRDVILRAVVFRVRYAVSYRDPGEILAERGVRVGHATLNRWVVKLAPALARIAQNRKPPAAPSWRPDETCVMVRGNWCDLCRAVDSDGQPLDFAARTFGSCSPRTVTRPLLRVSWPGRFRPAACRAPVPSTSAVPRRRAPRR